MHSLVTNNSPKILFSLHFKRHWKQSDKIRVYLFVCLFSKKDIKKRNNIKTSIEDGTIRRPRHVSHLCHRYFSLSHRFIVTKRHQKVRRQNKQNNFWFDMFNIFVCLFILLIRYINFDFNIIEYAVVISMNSSWRRNESDKMSNFLVNNWQRLSICTIFEIWVWFIVTWPSVLLMYNWSYYLHCFSDVKLGIDSIHNPNDVIT